MRDGPFVPATRWPIRGTDAANRLLGLDGHPPTQPGLYFPYQPLEPEAYLEHFKESGGAVLTLTEP
jgi:hypothetical protein